MIKVSPDVFAPLSVIAIDLGTLEWAPEWNKKASYIVTGVAYGVSALGLMRGPGADFVKNMAIASAPLTARGIYEYVKSQQGIPKRAGSPASRLVLRNTGGAPGGPVHRQYQPEFEGAGAFAL